MRVVAGIFGVAVILVMVSELFVTFLLPRRVRRDPRIARGLSRLLWLPSRAGSPPAAGVLLHQAIGRQRWRELERDLQAWEEWAAELMETHLSYPLLGFYRSQHVNQNWLAALTAMVDVAAFVKATAPEGKVVAADVTFAIGRHALADLALQFRLSPGAVQ